MSKSWLVWHRKDYSRWLTSSYVHNDIKNTQKTVWREKYTRYKEKGENVFFKSQQKTFSVSYCSEQVYWLRVWTHHYWHAMQNQLSIWSLVFCKWEALTETSACSLRYSCRASFWLRPQVVQSPEPGKKVRSAGNCVPPKSNPISDKTAAPFLSPCFRTKWDIEARGGGEEGGSWLRESRGAEDSSSLSRHSANHWSPSRHELFLLPEAIKRQFPRLTMMWHKTVKRGRWNKTQQV